MTYKGTDLIGPFSKSVLMTFITVMIKIFDTWVTDPSKIRSDSHKKGKRKH